MGFCLILLVDDAKEDHGQGTESEDNREHDKPMVFEVGECVAAIVLAQIGKSEIADDAGERNHREKRTRSDLKGARTEHGNFHRQRHR